MKFEVEIEDLKTTLDGLNNALLAYGDIIVSINWGAHVSDKWDFLKEYEEDELKSRFTCAKNLYEQLLTCERK